MRRIALLSSLLVAGLVALVTAGAGLQTIERDADGRPIFTDDQRDRLRIRPVAGKNGLFVIPGFDGGWSGGNVAVRVTSDGVVLVDDKFPYSHAFIIEQVASVTDAPIRYVLNTHHHGDHAGSNADFMPAAQVIGHRNVRVNMLRNDQDGLPSMVYTRQTSVFVGDVEVQAHHFGRGHTNGDSVIYFPDLRTIHTGDLFIWGERLDGSTLAPFMDYGNGGSGAEWAATLDGVLALDFDTVIPGHGEVLTRAEVQTFRDRMVTLNERMQTLIDEGVGRDDIAGRLALDDLDWPLGESALQALYDERRDDAD